MRITLALLLALLGWLGAQTSALAQTPSLPRLEPTRCFVSPLPDVDVDCGYLSVPEHVEPGHGDPQDTIQLAYMRYRTAAAEPGNPLVYIAGGPGGSGIRELADAEGLLRMLLLTRDVIVFDQRGTGYSIPSLNCFDWLLTMDEIPLDEGDSLPLAGCRDHWAEQGFDVSAFTTTASAADVATLIPSFGYSRAVLLGASYGSKLALVVMRNHPERVAAAVLDGAVPVELNQELEQISKVSYALDRVFALCTADQACNSLYPELEKRFYDLVTQLNDDPVTLTLDVEGDDWDEPLHGAKFISAMFLILFDGLRAIEEFPHRVVQAEYGDYTFLIQLFNDISTTDPLLGDGLYNTIHCSEEILLTNAQELQQRLSAYPALAAAWKVYGLDIVDQVFDECEAWGVLPAGPDFAEPVRSELPVLILQGGLDFQTPMPWALQVHDALPNSTLVYFPTAGHVTSLTEPCSASLVAQFAGDPTGRLDTSCVTSLPALHFYTPELDVAAALKPVLLLSDDGTPVASTHVPASWWPDAWDANRYSPLDAHQMLTFDIFEDERSLEEIAAEMTDDTAVTLGEQQAGEQTWQMIVAPDSGSWTQVYALQRIGGEVHLVMFEGIFVDQDAAVREILQPALAEYRTGSDLFSAFQPIALTDPVRGVTLNTVVPPGWVPMADDPLAYTAIDGNTVLYVEVLDPDELLFSLASDLTGEDDPEIDWRALGTYDWSIFAVYEGGWWYLYAVAQDEGGTYVLNLVGDFDDVWGQGYAYLYPMLAAFAVAD